MKEAFSLVPFVFELNRKVRFPADEQTTKKKLEKQLFHFIMFHSRINITTIRFKGLVIHQPQTSAGSNMLN